MFRYIVGTFWVLYILTLVESYNFSTMVEYKEVDYVPQEYHDKLEPFKLIGRKFYFIGQNEFNWFQAAQECRLMGGNLINLASEQERLLVGMQLNKRLHYWLDFNSLGQHEYVSIATGRRPEYEKFMKDDHDDEDWQYKSNEELNCVVLTYDYMEGFVMKKSNCLETAYLICQLSSPRTISFVVW